jgi:uncharacterized protein
MEFRNMILDPVRNTPNFPHSYSLTIRGHSFDFLGSRTVYWREASTLLAADLHWGKVEVFQKHGVPVPRGVLKDDLDRLQSALELTNAKRLLVLGDLIHASSGMTNEVVDEIAAWREENESVYFHLIKGNHDRFLKAPPEWKIDEQTTDVIEQEFLFSHDNVKDTEEYVWTGHLHPMARLERRGDSLRLPCFFIKPNCANLPAFSFFTGGVDITPSKGDHVLVIADGQVFKV